MDAIEQSLIQWLFSSGNILKVTAPMATRFIVSIPFRFQGCVHKFFPSLFLYVYL